MCCKIFIKTHLRPTGHTGSLSATRNLMRINKKMTLTSWVCITKRQNKASMKILAITHVIDENSPQKAVNVNLHKNITKSNYTISRYNAVQCDWHTDLLTILLSPAMARGAAWEATTCSPLYQHNTTQPYSVATSRLFPPDLGLLYWVQHGGGLA